MCPLSSLKYCCLSMMTTLEPLSAGFITAFGFWTNWARALRSAHLGRPQGPSDFEASRLDGFVKVEMMEKSEPVVISAHVPLKFLKYLETWRHGGFGVYFLYLCSWLTCGQRRG